MTNAEEADSAVETARLLQRSAQRLSRQLLAARGPRGLSLSKLGALGLLHRRGAHTATALATYLRIQPQSLTRMIADLERRGLIARRSDAEDRRQIQIAITEKGRKLLVADVRERQARLAHVIAASLSPAEQTMLKVATQLIDRLAGVLEETTSHKTASQ